MNRLVSGGSVQRQTLRDTLRAVGQRPRIANSAPTPSAFWPPTAALQGFGGDEGRWQSAWQSTRRHQIERPV